MQSTTNWGIPFPEDLVKTAFENWQKVKAGLSLAHKNFATEIRKVLFNYDTSKFQTISPESFEALNQKFEQLLAEDWQDAQKGIYPVKLLFETNFAEFAQSYLSILLDHPVSWNLAQNENFQSFPNDANLEKYPQYYRRNFHYQTDGYLTDNSANLYDLQVDILFNGVADAMRRRVLKPLKQGLSKFSYLNDWELKILDVACGTGRTLKFLRNSFPSANLYGIDLSSAYLRKANEVLSQFSSELPQLVEGNAESLPYQDNYFQGLSNVFLFHELPNPVRQKVINEFFRVLQPGGVLVICDSIQQSDSPELESMMANFLMAFHEPFYMDYIQDNIEDKLDKAGFIDVKVTNHAFSKCWTAIKPC